MNREIKAVSEALAKVAGNSPNAACIYPAFYKNMTSGEVWQYYQNAAQAAIAASDSKYIKGLVEALKKYQYLDDAIVQFQAGFSAAKDMHDKHGIAYQALQQLPEDRR